MTEDLVKRLREEIESECLDTMMLEAADRIEELQAALEELLTEAEDVFVCMADATGIDRHHHPMAFLVARSALQREEVE